MTYKTETIKVLQDAVTYDFYAGGASFLFLFHGFGQTAEIFRSFIPKASAEYSILAFDLFADIENKSTATAQDFISISQWNAIIEHICEKYSINTFSILSFSMGTRFAVSMLDQQASRMQRMVLIAPDGFGNTRWFRIATATYLTRKIFKAVMKYPDLIRRFANVLHKANFLNQITYRFIERNLKTKSLTEKIYKTWVYVRKLGISEEAFVSLIKRNRIKVLIVLGKGDQLVAADVLRNLSTQINAQVIELESAHHKLTEAIDGSEVNGFLIADLK